MVAAADTLPSFADRVPVMKNLLPAAMFTLFLLLASGAHAGEVGISVVFSDKEISVIQAWYREQHDIARHHGGGGKVGNGKGSKGLPPGIAKNLRAGKPLPPGIAKQALPSDLLHRLPPPPRGYERIEIAGKILLVEIATQVIHDVLEDIVFR